MSGYGTFDPTEAMLGGSGPTDHSGRKTRRSRSPQAPRPSAYERSSRPVASRGIYDHLAMVFRDAPCFIPQGAPLLAKLLQERVEGDDRLVKHMSKDERRSDVLIQDLVEYMIKRFWDRVPNDQRGNPLNTFISADWWDVLVEETLDHQRTLRIPEHAWIPGGAHTITDDDPFYSAFIAPEKSRPEGSLAERLQAARIKNTTTEESN